MPSKGPGSEGQDVCRKQCPQEQDDAACNALKGGPLRMAEGQQHRPGPESCPDTNTGDWACEQEAVRLKQIKCQH